VKANVEELIGATRYANLHGIRGAMKLETAPGARQGSRRIDKVVGMLVRGEAVHPQAP